MIKELICQYCTAHEKNYTWFPFGGYDTLHKFREGKSKYHITCDRCKVEITKGQPLTALTTYKSGDVPPEWSEDFVEDVHQ